MSKRDKATFDILGRIREECVRRNWSDHALAKYAGLKPSTISSWYGKNLEPTVASIEKVCKAFGISLSEFFRQPEQPDEAGHFPDYHDTIARMDPVWLIRLSQIVKAYEAAERQIREEREQAEKNRRKPDR